MSIRDQDAYEAASLYYLQGYTMDTIARRFGTSRSTVSRLLGYARSNGLVRVTLAPPPGGRGALADHLGELFGIDVWVVPVGRADTDLMRLEDVAQIATEQLSAHMTHGKTLGIAWGNTTAAITARIPKMDLADTVVVQLNGATNALDSGSPYAEGIISQAAKAFGARMIHFPVPAFFDYADTKAAMWRERSVQAVLQQISACDVALFGVGAMDAHLPSHVYTGGFLTEEEIATAKHDRVVGDICTVLIRQDGSTDMELNTRASGPSPAELRKIPRRICVAAGDSKAAPLVGALRAGVVTDLVIDSSLAEQVLRLVKYKER